MVSPSILWSTLACGSINPISVFVFTWLSFLCLCVSSPSFLKGTNHYLGLTLIHYNLILTQSHLQRSYFQIKSHLRLWINMNLFYSTRYTFTVLLIIHFWSIFYLTQSFNLRFLKIFLSKVLDVIYVLIS